MVFQIMELYICNHGTNQVRQTHEKSNTNRKIKIPYKI